MGERMFVIRESYPDDGSAFDPAGQPRITEYELKRRIEWIIQWLNADANFAFTQSAWDKVRSVVIEGLHGEGEVRNRTAEEAEAEHKFHEEHWEDDPASWEDKRGIPEYCPHCGGQMNVCKRGKPSSTPTREEWLKWIETIPYNGQNTWDMKAWLRTMPIVPRG